MLAQGSRIVGRDGLLHELVEHGVPPDAGVDHLAGDLPLPEAGDPDRPGEFSISPVEITCVLVGGYLHREADDVLVGLLERDLHI